MYRHQPDDTNFRDAEENQLLPVRPYGVVPVSEDISVLHHRFWTHEVYENDTWIHREIDLRWKLLVHLTPEQRESVPPANHSMNGGIYHERTTI